MVMQTLLRGVVRGVVRPIFNPRVPIPRQRRLLTLATRLRRLPGGVCCETVHLAAVSAQRNSAADARSDTAILYLHGGAYCVGSPETHRTLCAHLARAAQTRVYAIDYRLAPEHPFPAGLDDAFDAYCAFLTQGLDSSHLALAGDSAGGGLALALALRIRAAGLPMPAALYLISPWTDLTLSGESVVSRAAIDPMITKAWGADGAMHYAAGVDLTDPLLSPLFANLRGLPPLLIDVGSHEMLYSDAERLAERAREAGVEVDLRVHQGLWHVFHIFAGLLAPATAALNEAGARLRRLWAA